MSGGPPSLGRRPRRARAPFDVKGVADGRTFQVDLVGVRRDVVGTLDPGAVLPVTLLTTGATVCTTADGAVVGALVAFPGVSRLVEMLQAGRTFVARVEGVSPTSCRVSVTET